MPLETADMASGLFVLDVLGILNGQNDRAEIRTYWK